MGIRTGLELRVEADAKPRALAGKLLVFGLKIPVRCELAGEPQLAARASRPAKRERIPALASLGTKDWLHDLEFVAEELPKRHANFFDPRGPLSEDGWKAAIERVRTEIAEHPAPPVLLAKLIAARRDAHTSLGYAGLPEFAALPIQFSWLEDGLFVTAARPPHDALIQQQVIELNGRPIDEVLRTASEFHSAENDAWRKSKVPDLLRRPLALRAMGLGDRDDRITVAVRSPREGTEDALVEVTREQTGDWRSWRELAKQKRSRTERGTQQSWLYYHKVFEPQRAVYVNYQRCTPDPELSFEEFTGRVMKSVERIDANRLIIDLRANGGGASAQMLPLLVAIQRHEVLSKPGHVFALIGRNTFSSAMLNALELKKHAGAVLVGGPTGGKPNGYGEVRSFALPRSKLPVQYSTKFFETVDGDPPSVIPDQVIPLTSRRLITGIDEPLDWALNAPLGK